MSENVGNDRNIHQLYEQFKASKSGETKTRPIVKKLVEKIRPTSSRKSSHEQVHQQIVELIRHQPGTYQLAELTFNSTPPFGHSGFTFGFKYPLGEDEFSVDYFSYNHWGILVQKHDSDYHPEIEVLGSEDERGLTLLHLPEGYKIPVGPLHFEDDSLPMSDQELANDKAKAVEMAKRAGLKVNRDIIDIAERQFGPIRKYPDRYFYWQPILPDEPTNIAIDFDAIKPQHMGLVLEGAPMFNNTMTIKDKGL